MYVRLVPVPRFTTLLWRLPLGHRMRMIGPKGRFMLEPDDERTHLFVSTGTGIAPFISMCRQLLAQGRHAASSCSTGALPWKSWVPRAARGLGARRRLPDELRADDLAPRDDPRNSGWTGRTGRAEAVLDDVLESYDLPTGDTVVVHLRQPRHDHQRRGLLQAAASPRTRQEGALLAEGQEGRRSANWVACGTARQGPDRSPGRRRRGVRCPRPDSDAAALRDA